mmetsp:Transcript_17680/g.44536  ORF Transcript_17680/g.44536 Transcript_17680/m.44536 type:complete len:230 (+) Transcript_17680:289-978(+)
MRRAGNAWAGWAAAAGTWPAACDGSPLNRLLSGSLFCCLMSRRCSMRLPFFLMASLLRWLMVSLTARMTCQAIRSSVTPGTPFVCCCSSAYSSISISLVHPRRLLPGVPPFSPGPPGCWARLPPPGVLAAEPGVSPSAPGWSPTSCICTASPAEGTTASPPPGGGKGFGEPLPRRSASSTDRNASSSSRTTLRTAASMAASIEPTPAPSPSTPPSFSPMILRRLARCLP